MSWKFPRLTEVSPTADRDLGQAEKYFLMFRWEVMSPILNIDFSQDFPT